MIQKALFLESKQGPLVLKERGVPTPNRGYLLLKVQAAALNPVDYKIQESGVFIENYPAVLGVDMAGIVEEVGEGVKDFAKGDKVFSHGNFSNDESTYQQYAIAATDFTCKVRVMSDGIMAYDVNAAQIPPNLDFDQAATVPLGFDTAAVGLYSDQLGAGLIPPWVEGGAGKYASKPILIMGGSSSVGSYAIQLAKLSGFSPIITTSNPVHEHELKALGATHVIDRHLTKEEFAAAVHKSTQQPIEVAFDAISLSKTQQAAWFVLDQGGTLSLTLQPVVKEEEGKGRRFVATYGNPHALNNQAMCRSSWVAMGKWLKEGVIKPNKYEVLPNGLNGVSSGLERMKEGKISGLKLVVHPQETA